MTTQPTTRPRVGDRIEFDGQTVTVTVCHVGNAHTVQFEDGSTGAIALGADTVILRSEADSCVLGVLDYGNGGKTSGKTVSVELAGVIAGSVAAIAGLEAGW